MDHQSSHPLLSTKEFFGRFSSPRLIMGVAVVSTWVMAITIKNQQRLEALFAEPIQTAISARGDSLSLSPRQPNFLPLSDHNLEPGQKCKLVSITHAGDKTAFSLQMRLPSEVARQLGGISKPAAIQLDLMSTNPSFEPSSTTYADLVSALEKAAGRPRLNEKNR